jgi:hypothetical protein
MTPAPARSNDDSSFLDLLDVLLPGRGGVLVVLHAYFDASSRTNGVFTVAGLAFAKQQVKKFDKEWWELFGKYGGCHMKDLTHGTGGFHGIGTVEAGELLKQAIGIINKRISFGVSVSCDKNELNSLLPTWIQGFEHAYPVCCHMAMFFLGTHIGNNFRGEEIAYFFETGDEHSASAHRFMQSISRMPELKGKCLYHSHSFIEKKNALSLQAADICAWEWAKYWDETAINRVRGMRNSLKALIRSNGELDTKRHKMIFLTGEPLKQWADGVKALGLLQLQETQTMEKPPSASSPSEQ